MRIQLLHLYPDLMNLYGEYANAAALRRSLERQGAEVVVRTGTLYEDIDFSDADFIYMGAGTESAQLVALEDLRRYTDAVGAALARGTVVLATGNAMELFPTARPTPDWGCSPSAPPCPTPSAYRATVWRWAPLPGRRRWAL